MPVTLSTLFCTPQDVWDYLSIEGVDLRQDDRNRASGQEVVVSADAAAGATSLAVSNLIVPLLKGAQLTFAGGGMSAPATATLTAVANVNDTALSVAPLAAAVAGGARARDSGVDATTGARLVVGTRKGTSKVKLYCNQRYDDSELRRSGTVLDWAVVVAAKFLCTRRAQGCPKGVAESYEEAIEEMRMVQCGQLSIEDIGTRGVDWPSVSNLTVNPAYDFVRARLQPNISEGTPTAYPQFIDWNSAAWIEF